MDPQGKIFEQYIEYDWILEYCQVCQQVGHSYNPKVEPMQPQISKRLNLIKCKFCRYGGNL